MKLAIIHFSGTGNTTKLAEAVRDGARTIDGVDAQVHVINGKDIVEGRYNNDALLAELDSSDAIIFGSPTYMGGPAAQFKAFADATGGRWYTQAWSGKLAAGFTVSASPSGDKLSTLQYFNILAAQHGMNWINLGLLPQLDPPGPNRLGAYLGAIAQASVDVPGEADLATGRALGVRVASQLRKQAA